MQRLLYNYQWDADLVRDDLRSYAIEYLADAAAVQRYGKAGRELPDWRILGLCQCQGEDTAGPGIVPAVIADFKMSQNR